MQLQLRGWYFNKGLDWIGRFCSAPYYGHDNELIVDVVLFDRSGKRVGRESPRVRGMGNFEPACPLKEWIEIEPPTFPIGKYAELKDVLKRKRA